MKNLLLTTLIILCFFSCNKAKEDWSDIPQSKVVEEKKYEFFNEGTAKKPSFEPGVVLFKLRDNNSLNKISASAKHIYTKAMQRKGDNGFYKMIAQPGKEDNIINELRKNPGVVYAEKNWAVYTQSIPDDPLYNQLWAASAIHQADAFAHGNYGSTSVIVGIIDEPLLNCHEDLKDQIWNNPYETENGIDDDGNGYIDDMNGYNFVINSNNIYLGPSLSHGTHVAGTIGARGGNQKGVIGVSPYVTMIACPFLGGGGGYIDNAIKAMDYLTGLKLLHPELKISHSSNSWGGGGPSEGMKDAIDRAAAADIGFIAAAGNSALDNDVNDFYPANYIKVCPNVMAVGASDWSNNRASFSDIGKTTVCLFAPGTGILSTIPTSTSGSGYGEKSGTSMATPQVSGAAALIRAAHPDWTFVQIKAALIASVTKVPSLTEFCQSGGVLNLNDPIFFVSTPVIQPGRECHPWPIDNTPPSRPVNFRLYGGLNQSPGYGVNANGEGYFYVTADPSLPGEAVAGAIVYLDGASWTWGTYFPGGITGMPIRAYDIWCRYYDLFGNYSDTSNHIRFTLGDTVPVLPPAPDTQAPTLNGTPTVTNATTSSLTFNHAGASDNVGIVSYEVNWRASGGSWLQRTSTNLSESFNNLSEGTTYEFFYTAKDAAGNVSLASETISGTTLITPPPPPPPTYTITASLNGSSTGASQVTLVFSYSSTGTISLTQLERRKGSSPFASIANYPTSPYADNNIPTPGQYSYRLKVVLSNGQVGYSNEKNIQVKKK